ncbi:hypothetical protein CR513_38399, partial [Mucuna pruriens]
MELAKEENQQVHDSQDTRENYESDINIPILGSRTLEDVYARCNIAILELASYAKATEKESWKISITKVNFDSSVIFNIGVDFSNTFALLARHDTSRLLVSLAVKLTCDLYMDCHSHISHEDVKEEDEELKC